MWLLAIKMMVGDRGKFCATLGGVAFAVALANLQGGMLLGMLRKASMLAEFGTADVWVGHKNLSHVDVSEPIPERWVHRLRSVPGVERAEPYVISYELAKLPNGKFTFVVVVGCESSSLLGNAWVMAGGESRAVRDPEAILVDVHDVPKLGDCRVGDFLEINHRRARVAGMTGGIVSFTTTPYVFTTLRQAHAKYTRLPAGSCSYFLVKAAPGTDVPDLCRRIRERVPGMEVHDKQSYTVKSMVYWLTRTGIGLSFGAATVLGLLVGLAVVSQTLYSSVTERLKEFATLKALGTADGAIARMLVAQSLGCAAVGSVIGLAFSAAVGAAVGSPKVPVLLTWRVALLSVGLVVPVCLLAAWLPYWRVRRIDPASVLRN